MKNIRGQGESNVARRGTLVGVCVAGVPRM